MELHVKLRLQHIVRLAAAKGQSSQKSKRLHLYVACAVYYNIVRNEHRREEFHMQVNPSELRKNIYNLLDQVIETGIPLEINRKGIN